MSTALRYKESLCNQVVIAVVIGESEVPTVHIEMWVGHHKYLIGLFNFLTYRFLVYVDSDVHQNRRLHQEIQLKS